MKTARKSDFRNPKLAPEKRTKDLLARMTLEEKAAQMICIWQQKAETLVDAAGQFDPVKARVGSIIRRGPLRSSNLAHLRC